MTTMKKLFKLLIVAAVLYTIIAFISWDITWVTQHWFFRTMYLFLTIVFTTALLCWEKDKR